MGVQDSPKFSSVAYPSTRTGGRDASPERRPAREAKESRGGGYVGEVGLCWVSPGCPSALIEAQTPAAVETVPPPLLSLWVCATNKHPRELPPVRWGKRASGLGAGRGVQRSREKKKGPGVADQCWHGQPRFHRLGGWRCLGRGPGLATCTHPWVDGEPTTCIAAQGEEWNMDLRQKGAPSYLTVGRQRQQPPLTIPPPPPPVSIYGFCGSTRRRGLSHAPDPEAGVVPTVARD